MRRKMNMKQMKLLIAALSVAALVVTLGSCAKPPKAEADAAKAAVVRAESDADVLVYAPESLGRAKDSLAKMQKEFDAKKYDAAKALAQETIQMAEKAITDAKANKDRARSSASSTLTAVKTALGEAEKALAAAKKTRGVKFDFKAAAEELDAIKKSVASADADFNSGTFKTALEKAESAQSKIRDLTNKIADAVRAVGKKK